MKTQFKKLHPIFMLPFLFIIFNCQKDDAVDFNTTERAINTTQKIMSLDELMNLPLMNGKFSNVRTKDNDTVTKLYSAKYDFYIDTERVMFLQKGNYHSLSFPVIRTQSSGKLENLFLHPYNGGYIPYLIRYNFDAKDMLDLNNGVMVDNLIGKMEIAIIPNLDISGLGLPIQTFDNGGGDYTQQIFWAQGKCWVYFTHITGDDGLVYDVYTEYTSGPCNPPTGGSTGTTQQNFIFVDLAADYGSGGNAGNGGNGANGGGGAGNGIGLGSIWNPGIPGSISPVEGTNPNTPGFGNPLNGNPVIGVIGEGAVLNISNQVNKPCQKEIVNNILATSAPFINVVKSTFDSNQNVNLKFMNGDYSSEGFNATTTFPTQAQINSGNYTFNIVYDNSYLNTATDLSIVAVTLHEMVHAYLRDLYIKGQLVAYDSDYESLFKAYIDFYKDT